MDAMKKDGTFEKKISEQFFAGQDVTEPKDFKQKNRYFRCRLIC